MPDARRHWRRERGPPGVVGPSEAEATAQAAQRMCKRRLARRSRCVENCVVTLGRTRLEGAMGFGGFGRGVPLDSPKYHRTVALKESKVCVYIQVLSGLPTRTPPLKP